MLKRTEKRGPCTRTSCILHIIRHSVRIQKHFTISDSLSRHRSIPALRVGITEGCTNNPTDRAPTPNGSQGILLEKQLTERGQPMSTIAAPTLETHSVNNMFMCDPPVKHLHAPSPPSFYYASRHTHCNVRNRCHLATSDSPNHYSPIPAPRVVICKRRRINFTEHVLKRHEKRDPFSCTCCAPLETHHSVHIQKHFVTSNSPNSSPALRAVVIERCTSNFKDRAPKPTGNRSILLEKQLTGLGLVLVTKRPPPRRTRLIICLRTAPL